MADKRLKVLVVTNMYPSKSRPNWGTFVATQVNSLRSVGVDSDVMVIDGYRTKGNYLTAIPEMRRRLAETRYDLIHAHYGLSGLVARCQHRLPVVVSFCGSDLLGTRTSQNWVEPVSLIFAMLHKGLARVVNQLIVKSEEMRGKLGGLATHVIPNGVDFNRFRPMDQMACRAELGLDLGRRYVFFPYNPAVARKNFRALDRAVRSLNEDASFDENVEILRIDNEPNERIPLYLNAADVLALPSFDEGSPNAVKEALACNIPIVATPVGDIAELIGEEPDSRLVGHDAESIAAGLAAVLTNGKRTTSRDRCARLRIENAAAEVRKVYDKALALTEDSATAVATTDDSDVEGSMALPHVRTSTGR